MPLSGLLAVIAVGPGAPVTDDELDELVQTYRALQGETGVETIAGGRVRAALVGIDGAVPDTVGIDRRDGDWLASVHSTRRPLLEHTLAELDGQFAAVRYDAAHDEAVVLSDPFGMQVLFVARRGDRVYVSTSSLVLARHLRLAPNPLGLRVYLLTGSHFGTLTLWDGLERLDPATRLAFGADGSRQDTYWTLIPDDRFAGKSRRAVADEALEVLIESVKTDLAGRPTSWCDITSGYDSRLLVLAARKAEVDFELSTTGLDDDTDVRVGHRVAQAVGRPWHHFPAYPIDWPQLVAERLDQAATWGEGSLDVMQLAGVLHRHSLKRARHEMTITGGGGEHFRTYSSSQEFHRAGRTTRVNYDNWLDLRVLYPPVGVDVFAADPRPEVREDLRTRMEARARPYRGFTNDVQLDVLYAYKSMGHFGAYYSAARHEIHAPIPFYRKAIITAALSAPYAHKRGNRLMGEMIERLDARIADLPLEFGGVAAPLRASNAHRFAPFYAHRAAKLIEKLAQRAGVRKARRRAPIPSVVEARRGVVRHLSADGSRPTETWQSAALYSPPALRELVGRAVEPSFGQASLFGRIATVELALRWANASL